MNRFRMVLSTVALASLAASGLVIPGCTKDRARKVAGPTTLSVEDFKDARLITGDSELREAAARASRSPLVARAALDQVADPRLSLLPSGVVAAVGTAPDGSVVRMTLLPYQFNDDPDRARYLVLLESGGNTRVESFEMFRNRKPTASESDFERVNGGDHGLWLRSGPVYVQTQSGIARMAPERFNWTKFAWCFMPVADKLIGAVEEGCNSMGSFPGCVSVGSTAAIAGAAIYCAFVAWNG